MKPAVVLHEEPFRRELALPPGNSFLRSLTARVIGLYRGKRPEDVAAEFWPSDRNVQLVAKAASAPATTGTSGWAAELVRLVVRDALAAMGPASAGARVLEASTVLSWDGSGIISAPGFIAAAANAGFVAEGSPIPVRQLGVSPAQLTPHKIASIAVLSEEMIESSNAEQLIGDTLVRSAGAALDAALFDATASSAARPAGLRNGIATLTPSPNADAWNAFFEDVSALINAIAPVAGNGPYIMVAAPGRAVQMRLRALGPEGVPYFTYGSSALGNDLLTIAPGALVCAIDPSPEIEIAAAAELHMEDTTPSPIAQAVTFAKPVRSLFQTASIALRMRWQVSWILRAAAGVAWTTPAWK